jgi:shikimate kinase
MINYSTKKGLTFIGMPSSGKSATGKNLKDKLKCKYVDLDILILEKEGISHHQILKNRGEDALKKLEEKYTLELNFDNLIFSPPGSIIFSKKAMQKIKEESFVIYLGVSEEEIKRRLGDRLYKDGIIGLETKGLSQIISERLPLYNGYADQYIDTNGLNVEQVAEIVFEKILKSATI